MLDMLNNCRYTLLIGRVSLALVYFLGGLNWLINLSPPAGFIASKGLPMAGLLAWIALVFKLGGATLVILGYKTRIGALMLVAFTLVTAFVFHTPTGWPLDGTFLKELSMIGGLLILAATGPGSLSLDERNKSAVAG